MYKVYKSFRESLLDKLVKADQDERNAYEKEYLNKYGDWKLASVKYAKDNNRKSDDIFGDVERLEVAKDYIKKNIRTITDSSGELSKAWLLVQHMDNDVEFQQWFIKFLSKKSEEYKYLYDRIQNNLGLPQKYTTQIGLKESGDLDFSDEDFSKIRTINDYLTQIEKDFKILEETENYTLLENINLYDSDSNNFIFDYLDRDDKAILLTDAYIVVDSDLKPIISYNTSIDEFTHWVDDVDEEAFNLIKQYELE
jgi:hypothetical protein